MTHCVEALKIWTETNSVNVLYDTVIDEFTDDKLFQSVYGKKNVAIIGITTDGDVFGAFYRFAMTRREANQPGLIAFSFESNGRCQTPHVFPVNPMMRYQARVTFCKNESDRRFVFFDSGPGWFHLGDEKARSYCYYLARGFDGLDNFTLTGKNTGYEPHHCTRLIAVQLL